MSVVSAVLCVLCVLFCLTGCSSGNSNVPDGMKLASVDGAPFCLYVPTAWTLNTDSGLSGAYYSMTQKATVSANAYSDSDCDTVEDYWAKISAEYASEYKNFAEESGSVGGTASTLGDRNARKYAFSADFDGEKYRVTQYIAKSDGMFYVLTYSAISDNYEEHLEEVDKMAQVFSFEKNTVDVSDRTDGAPESMKIASSDKLEYVLYVPQNWIVNSATVSGAYFSETDRSNVSVVSYYGDEMTVTEYWEKCEAEYKAQFTGYTALDYYESKLGSKKTYVHIFEASIGGENYKFLQAISAYGEMMYTFTYTAKADAFESHFEDVEVMMEQFRFR